MRKMRLGEPNEDRLRMPGDATPDSSHPAAGTRPTRRVALEVSTATLDEAGVDPPRRNAEWLLGDVLGCPRAMLYAHAERRLDAADWLQVQEMVERRAAREPLQYIIGHQDFYGLRLRVTPEVLIPRPETEEVVEAALDRLAGRPAPRVLDVGTGSGCIALAIQHARPDATVRACDVSADALAVARRNARVHDLAVHFVQADMLQAAFVDAFDEPLDLLISNPPYIPDSEAPTLSPEVRDHEPAQALFTGTDALRYYRALVRHAAHLLTRGGWLVLETHAQYAEGVRTLLEAGSWSVIEVECDLADRPRMVCARYAGS